MKKLILLLLFIPFFSFGQNNPPISSNVSAATLKNTNASIHLVSTDLDFDDLTYTIVSNPDNGTISLDGDIVTYTPNTDFLGNDSFTFMSNDGTNDSNISTVKIKVFSSYLSTQTQIGGTQEGIVENSNNTSRYGHSNTINDSGDVIAIGSMGWGLNISSGPTRVFSYSNESWSQLGNDIIGENNDTNGNLSYGWATSLSSDGNIVAVSAPGRQGWEDPGRVSVFEYSNNSWNQIGGDLVGENNKDLFGYSISLNSAGNILAISSKNGGYIKVFKNTNEGSFPWVQIGENIEIEGNVTANGIGQSISLSSDGLTLVSGSPTYSSSKGIVRVHKFIDNKWERIGDDLIGEADGDKFGHVVSMNSKGDIIAAIAPQGNTGNEKGYVGVYKFQNDNWLRLGEYIMGEADGDPDSAISDSTISLSSDGLTIANGSPKADDNGSSSGHVRVFNFDNDNWIQKGDNIIGSESNSLYGSSVDLSGDGTSLVSGANYIVSGTGYVQVHSLTNNTVPPPPNNKPNTNDQKEYIPFKVQKNIKLDVSDKDIKDTLSTIITELPNNGKLLGLKKPTIIKKSINYGKRTFSSATNAGLSKGISLAKLFHSDSENTTIMLRKQENFSSSLIFYNLSTDKSYAYFPTSNYRIIDDIAISNDGKRAYYFNGDNKLRVLAIDVEKYSGSSNPLAPFIFEFDIPNFRGSGNIEISDDGKTIFIIGDDIATIDISNPDQPSLISIKELPFPLGYRDGDLGEITDYLYSSSSNEHYVLFEKSLMVIPDNNNGWERNINTKVVKEFKTDKFYTKISLSNDNKTAYLTHLSGLDILDIFAIQPYIIGSTEDSKYLKHYWSRFSTHILSVDEKRIYVPSGVFGLIEIDISSKFSPKIINEIKFEVPTEYLDENPSYYGGTFAVGQSEKDNKLFAFNTIHQGEPTVPGLYPTTFGWLYSSIDQLENTENIELNKPIKSTELLYTNTSSEIISSDSFSYKVNDGSDDSDIGNVDIIITNRNDTPIPKDQFVEVVEDIVKNITLEGIDDDILSFKLSSLPKNGKLLKLKPSLLYKSSAGNYQAITLSKDNKTLYAGKITSDDSSYILSQIEIFDVSDFQNINLLGIAKNQRDKGNSQSWEAFPLRGIITGLSEAGGNLRVGAFDDKSSGMFRGLLETINVSNPSNPIAPKSTGNDPYILGKSIIGYDPSAYVPGEIDNAYKDFFGFYVYSPQTQYERDSKIIDFSGGYFIGDEGYSVVGDGSSLVGLGEVGNLPKDLFNSSYKTSFFSAVNSFTNDNSDDYIFLNAYRHKTFYQGVGVGRIVEKEGLWTIKRFNNTDQSKIISFGANIKGQDNAILSNDMSTIFTTGENKLQIYNLSPDNKDPELLYENSDLGAATLKSSYMFLSADQKTLFVSAGHLYIYNLYEEAKIDDNLSKPFVKYISESETATSDSFTFKVNDGNLESETDATVYINITLVDDSPKSDNINLEEEVDKTISIKLSATDPDSSTLTFSIVDSPTNGSTSLDGDTITYTPNSGYIGQDSFTYKANDGNSDSNIANVKLTIYSTDRDGDGILNDVDNCPNTANADQADMDEDGIGDVCDDDKDGDTILNNDDNCPDTVNEDQADIDQDGIGDVCDDDKDGDTVLNADDNCPETANENQADIDGDGVGDVCDDDVDGDGVLNTDDTCPDTPADSTVDLNGCEIFTLPLDNNKVWVTSASCIGNTDGSIGLSIEDDSYNYTVTVTGQDDPISLGAEAKTASVTGLGTGTYTVCFKVDGQDTYEQCFEVNIGEPKALSVFIDVDNDNRTTSIQLSGSSSYNVEVNGQRYDVKGDRFTTSLPSGLSIIKISTDLDCQGIIEREIFISEDILYYPNPTLGDVNVYVNGEDSKVTMSVFSSKGDLIFTREQEIQSTRKTDLDLGGVPAGTYLVTLEGPTVRKTFKIVKR